MAGMVLLVGAGVVWLSIGAGWVGGWVGWRSKDAGVIWLLGEAGAGVVWFAGRQEQCLWFGYQEGQALFS